VLLPLTAFHKESLGGIFILVKPNIVHYRSLVKRTQVHVSVA